MHACISNGSAEKQSQQNVCVVYVCMYIYFCASLHICVHNYTYTYTHTHTQTKRKRDLFFGIDSHDFGDSSSKVQVGLQTGDPGKTCSLSSTVVCCQDSYLLARLCSTKAFSGLDEAHLYYGR